MKITIELVTADTRVFVEAHSQERADQLLKVLAHDPALAGAIGVPVVSEAAEAPALAAEAPAEPEPTPAKAKAKAAPAKAKAAPVPAPTPAEPEAPAAAEPEDAAEPAPAAAGHTYTRAEVQAAMVAASSSIGVKAVLGILQGLGVAKASELQPENFGAFVEALRAAENH